MALRSDRVICLGAKKKKRKKNYNRHVCIFIYLKKERKKSFNFQINLRCGKLVLKSINYFYILQQTFFTYLTLLYKN